MQPAWIGKLKVGDVVGMPSGRLRVVRSVSHYYVRQSKMIRTSVAFTIRHCSWTGRCVTTLTGNDLVQMGYRPTSAHVELNQEIDRQIQYELTGREGKWQPLPADIRLHCCDVKEVA